MNPSESEIEEQLRALRPRPPSHELEGKISAALASRAIVAAERVPAAAVLRRGPSATPATPARWWQGMGWAFTGAVTAAVVIVMVDRPAPEVPLAVASTAPFLAETLEHVDASAELVTTEDEGLVLTEEAEPAHRIRFTSYERHVWTNPTTGALMEYIVPREDIRLTPIALQ